MSQLPEGFVVRNTFLESSGNPPLRRVNSVPVDNCKLLDDSVGKLGLPSLVDLPAPTRKAKLPLVEESDEATSLEGTTRSRCVLAWISESAFRNEARKDQLEGVCGGMQVKCYKSVGKFLRTFHKKFGSGKRELIIVVDESEFADLQAAVGGCLRSVIKGVVRDDGQWERLLDDVGRIANTCNSCE